MDPGRLRSRRGLQTTFTAASRPEYSCLGAARPHHHTVGTRSRNIALGGRPKATSSKASVKSNERQWETTRGPQRLSLPSGQSMANGRA